MSLMVAVRQKAVVSVVMTEQADQFVTNGLIALVFKSKSIREEATTMEQSRQMYVKRELRRRRIEKRNRVITQVKEGLAAIALIVGAEVFMFALILM